MGIENEMIARTPSPFGFLPIMDGIVEREEEDTIILSPVHARPFRRVLHVNTYGGRYVWEKVKKGLLPGHQLLGCLELARMGYEVALAEPLPDFYLYRNPLPHDLRMLKAARDWLGSDGILYCGHNVLYWIPLLRMLGAVRCQIVSLLYAREPLHFARGHTGVIGLTPAATAQARKLAPRAKVAHLGWGVDLHYFQQAIYDPRWFLSCGIANRDFSTLCSAASRCRLPIRVICPGLQPGLDWPNNVTLVDGGRGWSTDTTKRLSPLDLIRLHYPYSAGTLVVMKYDPTEYTANGFTNVMEAMALAQPVIVTQTGALSGEIDVERAGIGLHVPPEDPKALTDAIVTLWRNPDLARSMGQAGRLLCESHYNMHRFSRDLDHFFESL